MTEKKLQIKKADGEVGSAWLCHGADYTEGRERRSTRPWFSGESVLGVAQAMVSSTADPLLQTQFQLGIMSCLSAVALSSILPANV